ncbi:Uncharacterised protein [uncultured Blautia sp.]|nr:hypothetical protein [uncultured Blautia sp.]SCI49347.1 Uncharacterised protein [uncultured Blautia sp.]
MELDKIEDTEILYRVVRESDPDGFVDGKPTAALFMDERGASVDRDGGRTEPEIIDKFKWRFRKNNDYKTAVKIGAGQCRSANTYPNPIGNKTNKYHAEIWDSENEQVVSLFKAILLAKMCKEVQNDVDNLATENQ